MNLSERATKTFGPALQWLWKQKIRVDRGYQMAALINLGLLLLQSDRLARFFGASVPVMACIVLPTILACMWLVGYLITSGPSQRAEDRACAEISPQRRDIDELIVLVRKIVEEKKE